MDRWVINASPLICLAKAGYVDLLLKLPNEAVIPQAVVDEIQAGRAGDPGKETGIDRFCCKSDECFASSWTAFRG
jgi:predicted nucleic acid-binding protein